MDQERARFDDVGLVMDEPDFMLEIVAELSHLARRASEVSQRSGVSVRVSISNLETLLANATRRAVRLGEASAAPRMSDLGALIPSTIGKLELESLSDEIPEERVVDRLLARAIHDVFGRRVEIDTLAEVVEAFESGLVIRTGESVPSRDYVRWMRETPGHACRGRPAGRRRIARGGRVRGRVPAGGPASPSAAEQGPGVDRRPVPGLTAMDPRSRTETGRPTPAPTIDTPAGMARSGCRT